MNRLYKFFSVCCLFTVILSSCHTPKSVAYLRDFSDSAKSTITPTAAFTSPVIRPDDLLSISIQTLDPASNALFMQGNVSTAAVGSNPSALSSIPQNLITSGYLVDKLGNVYLPIIGNVKLEGLTTIEARDALKAIVAKQYNNPTVEVNFSNIKITVLGEVARPATYTVVNEKVTILDALGLAGDMTIFGKRDNVLLIRDSLDKKELVRLNLNSKDIIASPYFFLKPNDVLYVEPNDSKVLSMDAYRLRDYTIAAAVLSVVIVLAARLR